MRAAARHLPAPHIGVIERPRNLAEFQPEQPGGTVEHRAQHRLKAQVGLQRRLIQIMLGLAAFLGIIAPVPRLQRPGNAIGLQHRLQHRRIGQRLGPRRLPDPHQEIPHRCGGLRHLRLQLEGREIRVAQQLRPLGPVMDGHEERVAPQRLQELLEARTGREVGFAIIDKRRSSGVVSGGDLVVGPVEGRHAVLVDDLISAGTTLMRLELTYVPMNFLDFIGVGSPSITVTREIYVAS